LTVAESELKLEIAAIDYALEVPCMPAIFRQNEFNRCLLEASYDGGFTWEPVFDFSLCSPVATGASFQFDLETRFENIVNIYQADGLAGLAPDIIYGDADDGLRDNAICYAIHRFVDTVCEAEIARRDAIISGARGLVDLAATISLVVVSALSLGTAVIIAFAVSAVLQKVALSVLGSLVTDDLRDTAARQELACCLYDELKSDTPSQAAMVTAAGVCEASLTGTASVLADAVGQLLAEDEAYVAFAQAASEAMSLERLEALPGCECDTWEHLFLNGDGDGALWTILPYDNPASNQCEGTYNAGADRFDGCNAGSGFAHAIYVRIDFTTTVITEVWLTGSGHETRSSASDNQFIYIDGDLVASDNFDIDWADEITSWAGNRAATSIRLKVASAVNGGGGTPDSRITQIIIRGKGSDPF
jgi:hypothetical protein